MIKINLNPTKQQVDFANMGGIDLTKVKIVPVMVAIALMYAPDFLLQPVWEEEINQKNQEMIQLKSQLSNLKKKMAQSASLEKQINELKAQEENLRQKLTAVKQAISEKRNPSKLLLFISKNTPAELWINELIIEGSSMTIKGEALNYASIGNFVSDMRSSIFIKEANIKGTSSQVRESDKRRIETFEVSFGIARFE
jgi:Tfp pilus assembly protein PilN